MNKCKLSSRPSCTISNTHADKCFRRDEKHLPAVKVHRQACFHTTEQIVCKEEHSAELHCASSSWTCHTEPVSFHIGLHSGNTLHARTALHLTCRKASYFQHNWVRRAWSQACMHAVTHTPFQQKEIIYISYIYILYLCIYIYLYMIYILSLNPDISKKS